ncbi:glycosyltransferase family 2 protein [Candidatus Saccharibacteria bacterium]|nr:glycosyltransferase family 2 protein [Candidatus Saccharibacteria bacterium]
MRISVIIPVYNAMTAGGGYITRCVESVLAQQGFVQGDIEILIVNDGSTDTSLDTLNSIATTNSSIRLVDQQNMGVANTRNKAIDLAKGEYIVFLDQDDWFDEDFCITLYTEAIESEADVVVSGYRRPNVYGRVVKKFLPADTSYGRYTLSAAWAKIHKTDFLRKNKIEFFSNSYGEDLPFMVKQNQLTTSYRIIPYAGYNWFLNEKSVSNTSQKTLTPETIASLERLFEELCSLSISNQLSRDFKYYLLRTAVFYLLFSGRVAKRDDFLDATRRIFVILEKYDKAFEVKNIYKLLIPPRGENSTVSISVMLFVIIKTLRLFPVFAMFWCKSPQR